MLSRMKKRGMGERVQDMDDQHERNVDFHAECSFSFR